jgi:hypothetical protein
LEIIELERNVNSSLCYFQNERKKDEKKAFLSDVRTGLLRLAGRSE